jgi:hypothetical protein
MTSPDFEIVYVASLPHSDEPEEIARRTVAFLPRVGDQVVLSGPTFGTTSLKRGVIGESGFEVIGVVFRDMGSVGLQYAEVCVVNNDSQGAWCPRCTCVDAKVEPLSDGTCDNCNGRLPRGFSLPVDILLARWRESPAGPDRATLAEEIAVLLHGERV